MILLNTNFWRGTCPCVKAAGVCDTFQQPIAVHSFGELGIQLVNMPHLGAVLPNLTFSADAHYHHLTDDILVGGKLSYQDGAIVVPNGPGLGVMMDQDRLQQYVEAFQREGGYTYDQDPSRPGWFALVPNTRWADHPLPGLPFTQY